MFLGKNLLALSITAALVACGGGGKDDYSKLTCANFSTQAAAQDAYNKGAKQLDGDGDGRACENLK